MSTQEFVTWLRGFVAGSSKYNLTPEGWDLLKDKLNEVVDNTDLNKTVDFIPQPWPSYPTWPYGTFVVGDPLPGQVPTVTCDTNQPTTNTII